MACPIQVSACRFLVAMIAFGLAGTNCGAALPVGKGANTVVRKIPCADAANVLRLDVRSTYVLLRQQLEAGSFYTSVVERFGVPVSCEVREQNGALGFSYSFSNKVVFIANFDPAISYSDHALEGPLRLTQSEAVKYLQMDEKDQFGVAGCGIAWAEATETESLAGGGRRERHRGDTCNCQGYIESGPTAIILIGFRSTC